MSTDFLKKINNRQLSIISTEFVNMGGCRSAPPYYDEKKDKTRSLFFRVFYLKKRKSRFSLQIKKRRSPFASLTETEKKGVLRTHIYNGAPPQAPHSPLGKSGVSPLKRQVLRSAMSRASVVLRTLDTALANANSTIEVAI